MDSLFVKCRIEPHWMQLKSSCSNCVNLQEKTSYIKRHWLCIVMSSHNCKNLDNPYCFRQAKTVLSIGCVWEADPIAWEYPLERGRSMEISKKGSVEVEVCPQSVHLRSDCSFPVKILWMMQRQCSFIPPQCWCTPFTIDMKNSCASCCSYSASLSLYLHTVYKNWCGV